MTYISSGKMLKKLKEILTEGGPSFNKMKMGLEEWLESYKKRNQDGDINVIKFIEWICDEE